MSTEEKLEKTLGVLAAVNDNVRLLGIKVEGIYMLLKLATNLIEMPEGDDKAALAQQLKSLLAEVMDEPSAKESLEAPGKTLASLGHP